MLEEINKYDLIITTRAIKKEILSKATKEKKLIKSKVLSKEEFIKEVTPQISGKALYFLMKKYKLNYFSAKQYLKNIYIKEETCIKYYNDLKQEGYITTNEEHYGEALIIKTEIDELYKEMIKEVKYYNKQEEKYSHKVYEFEDIEDEITGAAEQIIHDLNKEDIDNMYLVIPNDEYYDKVNRIFKLFHLPISKRETTIYSTVEVQRFLKELKEKEDIEEALKKTENSEVTNEIIKVLNKYSFQTQIDKTLIEIIESELKTVKIKPTQTKNIIKIIKPQEIESKEKYYYILGFNQNQIPKIYEEDGLVNDEIKIKNKLFTSIEKTKIEKDRIIEIITTYPNIYLSYKLKDNQSVYYPSSIIEDLKLEKSNKTKQLSYSNNYNKLLLAKLLDNYLNYGEIDENLNILYKTYPDIEYKTYSNKFKGLKEGQAMRYLNNSLSLSYTGLNNFYNCAFKYYIENILKINEHEDSFPILIGNLFHYILENLYEKDYDFDTLFTNYMKDKTLEPKEEFYLNKLKNILKQDIEVIKMQDNQTLFNKKETEKKITLKMDEKANITFTGIIDKLSYSENNLILTDYKTGTVSATLENIDDGLNLQLPSYIYLVKEGMKDKKIVGFYLQKLLNNKKIDTEENITNNLKLEGYTISNEKIISQIDKTYEDSQIIKGMKKTKTGFYPYTKLITEEDIDKISEIVKLKIEEIIKKVYEGKFDINPKKINKVLSCQYCKYKDLCYRTEEDIVELKVKPLKEIVGDESA